MSICTCAFIPCSYSIELSLFAVLLILPLLSLLDLSIVLAGVTSVTTCRAVCHPPSWDGSPASFYRGGALNRKATPCREW